MRKRKLLFRLVCFSYLSLCFASFAQKPVFKHYTRASGLKSEYINFMYQDKRGFLWIASDKGVSRFDGKEFVHFNTDNGLPGNMVQAISEDSSQNIILQVYEKGLYQITPQLKILPYATQKVSISNPKKYFQYFSSPNTSLIQHILSDAENAGIVEVFELQDYEKNLWFGVFGKGLFRYIPYLENYEIDDEIVNFYTNGLQVFFLGKKGIHIFNNYTAERKFLPLSDSRALQFWNDKVFIGSLYDWYVQKDLQTLSDGTHCTGIADIATKDQKMWVATFGEGLIIMKNNFQTDTLNVQRGLVSNNLEKIHLSPSYVWVSTYGDGISRINPKNLQIKNFTQKNGLLSGTVYDIFKEKPNTFWIATEKGISVFENDTLAFQIESQERILSIFRYQNLIWAVSDKYLYQVDAQNSLRKWAGIYVTPPDQNIAINRIISQGNHFFVLSNQGAFRLNMDKILALLPSKPRLELLSIRNLQETISWQKDKPLALSWKNKDLTLHFALLSYLNENENALCYRFKEKDSTWINLPSNHQLNLRNLDYGNFTLQIRMKNALGIHSDILSIPLVVEKPFWRKWWFIAMVMSVAFTLFAFLIRFIAQKRLKKRLKELELTQKLQTEKERIARELHDNIGSQLTYIVTSLEQIDKTTDLTKQNKRIQELSLFTKETIGELRETIWAINQQAISTENLLSRIQETIWRLNENLQGIKIVLHNALQKDFQLHSLEALNIFRIFQESLNNALKHSQATEIHVFLESSSETLTLIVQDNGIGINLNEKNLERHYGLKNMQKRATEIKAKLTIETLPQGTSIFLQCFLG